MAIDKKIREKIEVHVCKFFDNLDKSGINTDYAKEQFARMSDAEFERWINKDFPIQFQMRTFSTEPNFKDYQDTANFLGINLVEPIAMPFIFRDDDGTPVESKPALIVYLPIKRVQQMHTIKNHVSIDNDKRDPKTGRLIDESKSAQVSDREFGSLAALGLYDTMEEFSTIRADALRAKSEAYNAITIKGSLSNEDYTVDRDDSVAKNTISAYLMAAHIYSNMVNNEGYTPYTLAERKKAIERDN